MQKDYDQHLINHHQLNIIRHHFYKKAVPTFLKKRLTPKSEPLFFFILKPCERLETFATVYLLYRYPYPLAMRRKLRRIHALHSCNAIREIAFVRSTQGIFKDIRAFWQVADKEMRC